MCHLVACSAVNRELREVPSLPQQHLHKSPPYLDKAVVLDCIPAAGGDVLGATCACVRDRKHALHDHLCVREGF